MVYLLLNSVCDRVMGLESSQQQTLEAFEAAVTVVARCGPCCAGAVA